MNMPKFLLRCSLIAFAPIAANAAGTYYTGNYQSPQSRYTQKNYQMPSANAGSYTMQNGGSYMPGTTYRGNATGATVSQGTVTTQTTRTRQVKTTQDTSSKKGFTLDAGITHQFADWRFEMSNAASILHYDNLRWNVFDVTAGYGFDVGNTPMQINAGIKYGMQFGESSMIDDDISNGGYPYSSWESSDGTVKVDLYGNAISTGKSSGGNMLEFNVGFGLTDFFKIGNLRVTPSIGYRYLKYKLETKDNYGLAITSANYGNLCIQGVNDEIQCEPIVYFFDVGTDASGNLTVVDDNLSSGATLIVDAEGNAIASGTQVPSGMTYFNTLDSYYYEQPGVSHSYEVEWAGPYLALDALYDINENNAVNARFELGLPGYTATGDQPYRIDWAHPKSVEDKTGMFGALHLGLGANYMTRLTDSLMLTIGFTYDYYSVSGADATTYYDSAYMKSDLQGWYDLGYTTQELASGATNTIGTDTYQPNPDVQETATELLKLENAGWKSTSSGEIDSIYKSMGIRIGINARF